MCQLCFVGFRDHGNTWPLSVQRTSLLPFLRHLFSGNASPLYHKWHISSWQTRPCPHHTRSVRSASCVRELSRFRSESEIWFRQSKSPQASPTRKYLRKWSPELLTRLLKMFMYSFPFFFLRLSKSFLFLSTLEENTKCSQLTVSNKKSAHSMEFISRSTPRSVRRVSSLQFLDLGMCHNGFDVLMCLRTSSLPTYKFCNSNKTLNAVFSENCLQKVDVQNNWL